MSDRDDRQTDLLISIGLLVLVAAVFGQVVTHSFLGYDDTLYVTENPMVQRGLTWEGLKWAFVHRADFYYTPITYLSHMLDCQLFGLLAGWHHVSSVLLHAVNSVLLYFVLRSMTGARWPSALAAALFAVHPLHVESVAWIAERKDLVNGLFFFLCLLAYTAYARRGGAGRYALVFALFLLGLISKPMLVTLPGVLLVLDYWPLKRQKSWRWLVLEKVPLFVLSLAIAVVTFVAQRTMGTMKTGDQLPPGFRISNAIVAYGRYLQKTVWPFNLAVFYPLPNHWPPAIVVLCAILLALITVVAIRMRRQAPYMLVGWLWFLGMMLPVIGLVQVGRQAMADRYSYLPHIGIFILLVWWAASLKWRPAINVLAVCLVLAAAGRAGDQTGHWRNTDTLFEHALAVTPPNAVALGQVANARMRERKFDEAEALYRESLSLEPAYGMAHQNLGLLLLRRGDYAQAIEHFEAALRWRSALPRAHLGLGAALAAQGRREEAARHLRQALELEPDLTPAQKELEKLNAGATSAPSAGDVPPAR